MPSRAQLERKLARKLGDMSSKHRRELLRLLGSPPDARNVPASFWNKVKRETRDEILAMLLLIYIASATGFARQRRIDIKATAILDTGSTLRQNAEQFATDRAEQISDNAAIVAKKRLDTMTSKWRARLNKDLPVTRLDITQGVTSILGPKRDAKIARTETTGAKYRGESTAATEIMGPDILEIWTLGPCSHCTFCPLVAGTPREFWGRYSSGPAAHVHCCCRITFAPPGTPTKTWRPSDGAMRTAADESGVWGF